MLSYPFPSLFGDLRMSQQFKFTILNEEKQKESYKKKHWFNKQNKKIYEKKKSGGNLEEIKISFFIN